MFANSAHEKPLIWLLTAMKTKFPETNSNYTYRENEGLN